MDVYNFCGSDNEITKESKPSLHTRKKVFILQETQKLSMKFPFLSAPQVKKKALETWKQKQCLKSNMPRINGKSKSNASENVTRSKLVLSEKNEADTSCKEIIDNGLTASDMNDNEFARKVLPKRSCRDRQIYQEDKENDSTIRQQISSELVQSKSLIRKKKDETEKVLCNGSTRGARKKTIYSVSLKKTDNYPKNVIAAITSTPVNFKHTITTEHTGFLEKKIRNSVRNVRINRQAAESNSDITTDSSEIKDICQNNRSILEKFTKSGSALERSKIYENTDKFDGMFPEFSPIVKLDRYFDKSSLNADGLISVRGKPDLILSRRKRASKKIECSSSTVSDHNPSLNGLTTSRKPCTRSSVNNEEITLPAKKIRKQKKKVVSNESIYKCLRRSKRCLQKSYLCK